MQVESDSEVAAAAATTTAAVLNEPLSLEGGLAAELRPANLVQRVLSLFRNVRPGADLSHFQVHKNSATTSTHSHTVCVLNLDPRQAAVHGTCM